MAEIELTAVTSAIETLLRSAMPLSVVITRPILGLENDLPSAAYDAFRNAEGRIDAWMLGLGSLHLQRDAPVSVTPHLARRARRYTQRWRFELRRYYGYETGTSQANSYAAFMDSLLTVQRALAVNVKLIPNNELFLSHDELQVRIPQPLTTQAALIHFAVCELVVNSYRSMTSI